MQAGDKSKEDPLCPGAQGTSTTLGSVGTCRGWHRWHHCQAANALLLKVNQIGSITEAITAYLDSASTGWGVMVLSSATQFDIPIIIPFPIGKY